MWAFLVLGRVHLCHPNKLAYTISIMLDRMKRSMGICDAAQNIVTITITICLICTIHLKQATVNLIFKQIFIYRIFMITELLKCTIYVILCHNISSKATDPNADCEVQDLPRSKELVLDKLDNKLHEVPSRHVCWR